MNDFSSTKLMRRLLTPLFFTFALFLLLPSFASAQTGVIAADRELQFWRSFEPEGGNFKVSLPVEPTLSSKTLTSDYNDYAEWTINTAQVKTAYSVYEISFAKLPPNVTKDRLKTASEGGASIFGELVQKANGIVQYKKDISKNGVLAYESLVDMGSATLKLRRYYTPEMIYEVSLVTPDLRVAPTAVTKVYQVESDKFFNSFSNLG